MVHCDRTVVDLVHKLFRPWLSPCCNFISIITRCTYTTMSESNITAYVSNLCTFSSKLITCNCSSVLIVFCWFFTWNSLGDVALRICLTLVRKANAVDEETRWTAWLYHYCEQSIRVTDGMTVILLFASLQHKARATMWSRGRHLNPVLCECEALASLRHPYLGSFFLDPEDI
jgi:hypothetical protein